MRSQGRRSLPTFQTSRQVSLFGPSAHKYLLLAPMFACPTSTLNFLCHSTSKCFWWPVNLPSQLWCLLGLSSVLRHLKTFWSDYVGFRLEVSFKQLAEITDAGVVMLPHQNVNLPETTAHCFYFKRVTFVSCEWIIGKRQSHRETIFASGNEPNCSGMSLCKV